MGSRNSHCMSWTTSNNSKITWKILKGTLLWGPSPYPMYGEVSVGGGNGNKHGTSPLRRMLEWLQHPNGNISKSQYPMGPGSFVSFLNHPKTNVTSLCLWIYAISCCLNAPTMSSTETLQKKSTAMVDPELLLTTYRACVSAWQ
jgi:hypothetical protein